MSSQTVPVPGLDGPVGQHLGPGSVTPHNHRCDPPQKGESGPLPSLPCRRGRGGPGAGAHTGSPASEAAPPRTWEQMQARPQRTSASDQERWPPPGPHQAAGSSPTPLTPRLRLELQRDPVSKSTFQMSA